ncbi:MAG: hypothetical protein A2Z21_07175 [Candidatus Fraserbacteria bacterium RBG_16_55_9]|uniref:Zinc-finger domain-containing protein n=1 Tax=Fraserbacteria sp. (strain RBG_16_55_9) TaxID=1817864 RepID=A0A1F5USL2_FRAXR|nr:MAG: hypothetical protein A2Z21_07175 [Candidatus Fraserbacteria bacterium RBG_16_55_9]
MSRTPGNDPKGEHLEEFQFLFSGLQHASLVHPPQNILEEYVRGIRPKGTDSQGWQSHAVSAHVGLCPTCGQKVERLRHKQQTRQTIHTLSEAWSRFWRGAARWRRAYQYVGILVFITGLIVVYSFMRGPSGGIDHTPQAPGDSTDSSGGLARLR